MERISLAKNGFQPGHKLSVGNQGPVRKAEKRRLTALLIDELERETGKRNRTTNERRIIETLVKMAIAGNGWAINYIYNRVEGPLKQVIENTGESMQINIINSTTVIEEAMRQYDEAVRLVGPRLQLEKK